jgi:predicted GNAT family N-acyltransferase
MQIIVFNTADDMYSKALQLRTDVLRTPLGLKFTADELKKDKADTHFGLIQEEILVACLTLTECADERMKMRQVAVSPNFQGQGFGKILVAASHEHARGQARKIMFCHARKTAVPFYESMGYKVVGAEFFEVNIPHYLMEREL